MGKHSATQQIVINASAQDCFDAITEYDTFHQWQTAVDSTDVLETDDKGRGKVVELTVNAKVKTIRYQLHYHYEEPTRIWWEFLEGDVKDIGGSYLFDDRGDGTTLATYTVEIDPGVWVPGRIAKMMNDDLLKRSLDELKARVESNVLARSS